MQEIGEKLKETRESMGVSIEEAAEDMKLRPSQIENIEKGNMEAFKDIFYLKYFIRDYAKYLGLNYEDLVDEFNEFLFDYTSQISLEDIKKASKKNKVKVEEKKVSSPYTHAIKERKMPPLIKYIIMILILVTIIYFIKLIFGEDGLINNFI